MRPFQAFLFMALSRLAKGAVIGDLVDNDTADRETTVPRPSQTSQSSEVVVPNVQKYWGPLAPYHPIVPSNDVPSLPQDCKVTFVQVLARHGARTPRDKELHKLEKAIKDVDVTTDWSHTDDKWSFFKHWELPGRSGQLGVLTAKGRAESRLMGQEVAIRYGELLKQSLNSRLGPVYRSPDDPRLLNSAAEFDGGFKDSLSDPQLQDYPFGVIVGAHGKDGAPAQNSLRHANCPVFERLSKKKPEQKQFNEKVLSPQAIEHLRSKLVKVGLKDKGALHFMSLCPYDTAALSTGQSPFCDLFTEKDWKNFDYSQTLHKWYRNGPGMKNQLGPTQGVPWLRELMARITGNRTYADEERNPPYTAIDHDRIMDAATFPLFPSQRLFVDFTHGSDIISILFALGVYPREPTTIENTAYQPEEKTAGFTASSVVPFATRVYFERLSCKDPFPNDYVRVILNDQVMLFEAGKPDQWGRMTIKIFEKAADWALKGGNWAQCTE